MNSDQMQFWIIKDSVTGRYYSKTNKFSDMLNDAVPFRGLPSAKAAITMQVGRYKRTLNQHETSRDEAHANGNYQAWHHRMFDPSPTIQDRKEVRLYNRDINNIYSRQSLNLKNWGLEIVEFIIDLNQGTLV